MKEGSRKRGRSVDIEENGKIGKGAYGLKKKRREQGEGRKLRRGISKKYGKRKGREE